MNFVQSATRATKHHVPDAAKKDSTKSAPSPKRNFKLNKPLVFKCYFCKKAGHMKKNYLKYKTWLAKQEAKKGKTVFACFESNLINIPSTEWWLDSGSSIHLTSSLQDFTTRRTLNKDEVKVSVGNRRRVEVKALGSVRLKLEFGFYLELDNVVYVPSMKRKLISISKLVLLGFYFTINKSGFNIFYESSQVGNAFISDGMFQLKLNKKECVFNAQDDKTKTQQSSILWRKRLGHISKQRMELLVRN